MFFYLAVIAGCLALGAYALLNQAKFGKLPDGERLEILKKSPNYVDGAFQNLESTQQLAEGVSFASIVWDSLFTKTEHLFPSVPLPTVKTDLKALDKEIDTVIWLGHSSYFVQLGGKRILIDPVFSTYAAPFFFLNKAFAGTTAYTADDMPEIDYLLISHDHWDHLDYPTIVALEPKVGKVVSGLGVGAHFAHWGYAQEKLVEGDWYAALKMDDSLTVHVLPARHFSGRLLAKNKTLWVAFALETPERRIFFGGDGGYGAHIQEIAKLFPYFDLAILEDGQYDARWAYIHMMPEETAQAAGELKAKALLPAHLGKFSIADHAWDEPLKRIAKASANKPYRLLTPMIGEPVKLDDEHQMFSRWWEGLE